MLILAILSPQIAHSASNPSAATINLVATIPNTCSLVVMSAPDSLALGEAIRTQSLERFAVPLAVDCNTPNAKLRAKPVSLTSSAAPGYQIYYHINTDIGVGSGLGWINTSFDQNTVMAQFPVPVKQEILIYMEGFKEVAGKTLPAGNYNGYIQLTIGAE
jgi:hypothetical protein